MINRENYITIQGWMVTELGLKGNDLLVYAIIYGFSQADGQVYSGGLQYLADWTNSTKRGIIKNIQGLLERGLIERHEKNTNNVVFCEYRTKFTGSEQSSPWVVNKVHQGSELSSPGVVNKVHQGSELSSPNNTNNNLTDNTNKNIYCRVIGHLNEKAGTKYRSDTPKTVSHLHARLADGYTEQDMISVVDKMVREWKGTKLEKFLRPETLFGSKFEGYLNRHESHRMAATEQMDTLDDIF